jgi:hypothetical protein
MIHAYSDSERADLLERVAAVAIANQAILKCTIAGSPLTIDNVLTFVGEFADDPTHPAFQGVADRILAAIEEVLASGPPMEVSRASGSRH